MEVLWNIFFNLVYASNQSLNVRFVQCRMIFNCFSSLFRVKEDFIYCINNEKLHNSIILKKIFFCFEIKNRNLVITSKLIIGLFFVCGTGGYNNGLGGVGELYSE